MYFKKKKKEKENRNSIDTYASVFIAALLTIFQCKNYSQISKFSTLEIFSGKANKTNNEPNLLYALKCFSYKFPYLGWYIYPTKSLTYLLKCLHLVNLMGSIRQIIISWIKYIGCLLFLLLN